MISQGGRRLTPRAGDSENREAESWVNLLSLSLVSKISAFFCAFLNYFSLSEGAWNQNKPQLHRISYSISCGGRDKQHNWDVKSYNSTVDSLENQSNAMNVAFTNLVKMTINCTPVSF